MIHLSLEVKGDGYVQEMVLKLNAFFVRVA